MAVYSKASAERLRTCRQPLQLLFQSVLDDGVDHAILEGHRGQASQDAHFKAGRSRVRWPNGNHNSYPSAAVDAAPHPVKWPSDISKIRALLSPELRSLLSTYIKRLARFYYFAGYVMGRARGLGIQLRSGADWDGDFDLEDQHFDDLVHFELKEAA